MSDGDKERWDAITNKTKYSHGKDGKIEANITSPFNFVEPSDVIFPSPLSMESEDNTPLLPDMTVPLQNGICGNIEIDWTFETDFLIGHANSDEDENTVHASYSKNPSDNDLLLLPGSSQRGMIRSVLELATASRIVHFDQKDHHAFRDFSPDTETGKMWRGKMYPNGDITEISTIKGGYLVPPNDKPINSKKPEVNGWRLIPCRLARINKDLAFKILSGDKVNDKNKIAKYKNDLKSGTPAEKFRISEPLIHTKVRCLVGKRIRENNDHGADWWEAVPEGEQNNLIDILNSGEPIEGHITLHGDGATNKSWLFHFSKEESEAFEVAPVVMERFFKTHRGIANSGSALDYWLERCEENSDTEIRVVFNEKPLDNENIFISMSRFMKVPHKYGVGEMADKSRAPFNRTDDNHYLDFVQALFGHVPPEKVAADYNNPTSMAWKSRIFFSDGISKKTRQQFSPYDLNGITEKPRSSFAPFYLRTDKTEKIKENGKEVETPAKVNWSSDHGYLAGVKRYPVRKTTIKFPQPTGNSSGGNISNMKFNKAENGVSTPTFRSQIRLHNVSQIELGGVLWALGLCELERDSGQEKVWRHALGRGKAQGFGRVRAELVLESLNLKFNSDGSKIDYDALQLMTLEFKEWVLDQFNKSRGPDSDICTDFNLIPFIRELRAMSDPEIGEFLATNKRKLSYPEAQVPAENIDRSKSIQGYVNIKNGANLSGKFHLWRYPRERYEKD